MAYVGQFEGEMEKKMMKKTKKNKETKEAGNSKGRWTVGRLRQLDTQRLGKGRSK